jgi:hypothetical protein
MAITTQMRTDVANLYVALFGRAPERDGLGYWVQQLDAGKTVAQVAQEMYDTTPARATYPSFLTNDEIIARFYENVLGRVADAEGKAYWSAKLTAGQSAGSVISEMITAVTAYAGTDTAALNSKALFENKVTVGLYYAVDLGGNDVTKATTILTGVTEVASTVDTAKATAATAAGSTFSLTTGTDSITGTTGNDQINAYIDAANATDTLTASDVVDGGNGTDTMVITTDGNQAGALPAATISNVEVFSIREVGGTAGVYDFGTVAGETSVINRISTDAVTFSNLGTGTTLTIKGDGATANGATTFTMASTTAAVTLNLDGGVGTTAAPGNITRDQTGAATVTINSTGAANVVGTIDLDTATALTGLTINATTGLTGSLAADYAANSTLTVTGAGAVNLTGATLSTNITTVTAAAQTAGGLGVKLGANTTSFVGGAGNDTVFIDALVTGSSKTVAAGEGTGDLVRLTDEAALTTATAANITGFEILRLADDNDGALDTFNMSQLSGLTALQLDADSAGDGYSITNMSAAQAAAVTIRGTQAVTPTFGVTGATTVGQLDTLGLTIDDGATTTSTITVANLTAAGVETVTIAANDHFTATSLNGLGALTNMTVTGAKNVSLTTGVLALNVNTIIDASAVTGTVTIDASAATTNGAAIKGSSTKDNILKGGVGADAITGGTGIDTVTTAATGADTVDFVSDSSADILEIAALTGRSTVTNFDVATTSTTEDIVNVSHDDLDGAEVSITAAAAQGALGDDTTIVISQAVGTAASLTTGGTATLAAADFTATTLTNLATFLGERFTADNADTTAGNQTALIVLNNGTNTYAYVFSDSATQNATIEAAELTLVGVFNSAILNAGDIIQTV